LLRDYLHQNLLGLKAILSDLQALGRIEDGITLIGDQIVDVDNKVTNIQDTLGNFRKLEILSRLPQAENAQFDSYFHRGKVQCLENTRVDLLNGIYRWAKDSSSPPIFWLSGWAGTGKSTISRTVASTFFNQGCLGASFLFSRDEDDLRKVRKLFTTLASQLAINIPSLRDHIIEAIETSPNIANQNLKDQWEILVLQPLSKLVKFASQTLIFVLDALDECENKDEISLILRLLSQVKSLRNIHCRIFLTSRPDLPIRCGFDSLHGDEHRDVVLHDVE